MNICLILAAAIEFAIGPGTPSAPSAEFPLKVGERPTAFWYDDAALHVGTVSVPWAELKTAPTNGASFTWKATSADGEKIHLRGRIAAETARYSIPSLAELSEKRVDSTVKMVPRKSGTVKVSSRFKGPRSPICRQFKQASVKAGETAELKLVGDETTDLGYVNFELRDVDGTRIFWTHEWQFRARDLRFALRSLHTDRDAVEMIVRTDNWFGDSTNYSLRIEMDDYATGKRVWETTVPALPTSAPGNRNGCGIKEQRVDVKSLPGGEYKCHVSLIDPSGKVVYRDYRTYAKPDGKAPWEGTAYGAEDTVPPPWTKPVWREDGFSCWNRSIRFGGGGIVSSAVSAGREMLAAPVEVLWNGKPLRFSSALVRANVADAFYRLTAENAPVTVDVRAEFDGVMWFELSYTPPVGSIDVVVAARRSEVIGFDDGKSMKEKILFEKGKTFLREYNPVYSPRWWMGDVIGIMGGVDAWHGYHVKNINRQYRIEADSSVVRMTTRIVDTPLAAGARATAGFYLQTTPVKPKNREIAALPPSMIRSWTGHFGYFFEDRNPARIDKEKNRQFEEDKKKGMRVFYYNATSGVSTVFPWWGWFGDDWTFNTDSEIYAEEIPFKTEESKRRSPWVCGCLTVPGFFDFKLKDICDFLWNPDFNIRDMYFDLTEPRICKNVRHGCSYKDAFGNRRFGYGTARYHELLKRVYREMKKKNPDSAFLGHILRSRSPAENFFDALTMGEGYDRDICYSLSYYDVLTPGLMRVLYASRASDVTMRLLPQMSRAIKMYRPDLKDYDPDEPRYDRANRHCAAYFKIHDLSIVGCSAGKQWTKPDATLTGFGLDRTHSAYYSADCPVSVSDPHPRFIYALYSGNGRKMLILLNDTDSEMRRKVSVKGLTGRGRDIFGNGEYDFTGGECTFTLPPRESRFVLFGAEPEAPHTFSVVSPEKAKPWEKHAAAELDTYLRKLAADGKITVDGRDGVVFHVGDTAFAASNGLSSAAFADEEWAIKSFGGDVVLNGGGTRGCLYAVYRFLEDRCGVRWWIDGDEDVPSPSALSLPALDSRGRPHFFYRNIYRAKKGLDFRNAVRNRVNVDGDIEIPAGWGGSEAFGPPYHCHTWRFHVPWEKYGKTHPEYFPLVKGKRVGGKRFQLCLTNPDLPAVVAASVERSIAKGEADAKAKGLHPPRLYDMSMNDASRGYCECAECVAVREKHGYSGYQLLFDNKVAAMLAKKHPDLLFSVFAYYAGEAVPKSGIRAADNLVVKLCNTKQNMAAGIFEKHNRFMHDQTAAWNSYAKNLFVWDYTKTFEKTTEGFPFANEFYIGERLRYFADNGVIGMLVEHENPHKGDFYELKYHLLARFLEDPYRDADAVRKDFMTRYYGAAAVHLEAARRYLDGVRKRENGFVTWFPKLIEFSYLVAEDYGVMEKHFDAAEQAVAGDAKRLARVRRVRVGTAAARKACVFPPKKTRAPEEGVSDRSFYDFPAASEKEWVLHSKKIGFVDDKDAFGGRAVYSPYYCDYMRLPFSMGVYAQPLRKHVKSRAWKKSAGEGYHWYDMGRVDFPEVPVFLYLTKSWTIQIPQMAREFTGKSFRIKAHVKFGEEGLWVDRVVMIPEE